MPKIKKRMGRKPKYTIVDGRRGEETPIKQDAIPVVFNKPQMHSYLLSSASYHYSLYAQRIKLAVIQTLQGQITDFLSRDYNFYHLLEEAKKWAKDRNKTTIVMPIKFITENTDHDIKLAEGALDELLKTRIKYEHQDKLGETIRGSFTFAESYKIYLDKKIVSVGISEECYLTLLNFIFGYSQYDLHIIRKFKSLYSVRLYEILYGQEKEFFLTFDEIRKMFMLADDKYKAAGNIKKFIIEYAKKEIDKLSPRTFDVDYIYKKNGSPKGGRSSLHAVRFMPKDNPNVHYVDQEQIDKMRLASKRRTKTESTNVLSYDIVNKLEEYGITREGMVNGKNAETLMKFDQLSSEEIRYHFWQSVNYKMSNSVKEIYNKQGFVMKQIQDFVERYEREKPEHADEEARKFNDIDALPF